MTSLTRVLLRAAIIPGVVIAYITVSGLTGFCPSCTSIMNCVLGRDGTDENGVPASRPVGASVLGLSGYSLDGGAVPLSSLKQPGKPMIIEVWATWCPPCREQRKTVAAMGEDLTSKVTLVSMSVDNDPRTVRTFLEGAHRADAELMASPEALRAFGGVSAIPTLVFVDSEGNIREVTQGALSGAQLRKKIQGL